jgi:hypothetical protein
MYEKFIEFINAPKIQTKFRFSCLPKILIYIPGKI